MELALIFKRNGSQKSLPPSLALSLAISSEPQPLRTPVRGPSTARQREVSAPADDVATTTANDADGIHSPLSKKARATERCCPCIRGVCTVGGGPGGTEGCPCRRAGRNCEITCECPDCQNFSFCSTGGAPRASSNEESFWNQKLTDAESTTKATLQPQDPDAPLLTIAADPNEPEGLSTAPEPSTNSPNSPDALGRQFGAPRTQSTLPRAPSLPLDEPSPPDSPDPPSISSDPPEEIEAPQAPNPPSPSTDADDEPDADDDANQPAKEAPESRILPDEGGDLRTYVLT
jgi:hypothetical protein